MKSTKRTDKKPTQPKVFLVSLGCAKNTVDSSSMAELLAQAGYEMTDQARRAEVLLVNTCGFIGPAKDESFEVLADLAANKRKGQLLIAAGCLTQRYGAEVARRVPGIDGILGTRRWVDIVEVVQNLRASAHPQPLYHLPEAGEGVRYAVEMENASEDPQRRVPRVAVQGGSAYLKIADGCRRPCAFCAIPLIKGTAVSRSMDAILADARYLVSHGAREINLIAQDTTDYGHDLVGENHRGMQDGLARLLEALCAQDHSSAISNTIANSQSTPPWFRILYAYPGYVTDRLIEVMATHPQILHYLDMPLQHAHPDTLRRMRRPANIEWVYRTLEKMRRQIPDLALRTTFIVGYPGETEVEFQALLDFVKEIRFDRVGTFQFSFEPGTASQPLGDPIPPAVKEERYDRLMALQQEISLAINQSFVGKTLPVLIEGEGQAEYDHSAGPASSERPSREASTPVLIGRSYRDAPEIDGVVVVERERAKVAFATKAAFATKDPYADQNLLGQIVPVRITGAMAYDLVGTLVENG